MCGPPGVEDDAVGAVGLFFPEEEEQDVGGVRLSFAEGVESGAAALDGVGFVAFDGEDFEFPAVAWSGRAARCPVVVDCVSSVEAAAVVVDHEGVVCVHARDGGAVAAVVEVAEFAVCGGDGVAGGLGGGGALLRGAGDEGECEGEGEECAEHGGMVTGS